MLTPAARPAAASQEPLAQRLSRRAPWIPLLFQAAAVALGGLHSWAAASMHAMNEDGIAYLDIGDAFGRGDWVNAINPVWSPLYAWLLGLVLRIVQPPMRWEFPVVQLVNFGVYLATLLCFQVFWRQAGQYRKTLSLAAGGKEWSTLPDWAWASLGYGLFIWTALGLIEVWSVTPDMLMAGLVYLIGTVIVRIRMGLAGWRTYMLLGLLLGLGYLAKAIMFPLAFIFLAAGGLAAGGLSRSLPRVAVAGVVFAMIAGPYLAMLFVATGRLTVSDAGRMTYLRYVNGVPYPHWQGGDASIGLLQHPSRQIHEAPLIYEFAGPVGGTYPIGHDPSYWYAGAAPGFDIRAQTHALVSSAQFYIDLFFRQQAGLVLAAIAWYGLRGRRRLATGRLLSPWSLALPAMAAFVLYGLVYVEGRYVGVFVTLLWADVLANVHWPAEPAIERMSGWLCAGALALLLINILAFNLAGFSDFAAPARASEPAASQGHAPSWPGEVAEELQRLGLRPGDRIGIIGHAFDSFWARLARVQIVAEMPGTEAGAFWAGDARLQAQVVAAFRQTGARAIVAQSVPSHAEMAGWQRLGQTNDYIYLLEP